MPGEVAMPGGKVQRPRTSPALTRNAAARQAAPGPGEPGGPEVELLEYEWPDLPPLPTIKDAITRRRVARGISYLLPVDKGRNSINNRFRTDLRAMFQEPYASDDLQYDDSRVALSSKVHFVCNKGNEKWTRAHLQSLPVSLNAASEESRKLYAQSAPSGGVASRRMGIDPHQLRTRSSLYLPLKASVPPELTKLRREVDDIIKSVKEDDEDWHDDDQVKTGPGKGKGQGDQRLGQTGSTMRGLGDTGASDTLQASITHAHKSEGERGRIRPGGGHHAKRGGELMASLGTNTLAAKLNAIQVQHNKFNSYDELKASKPPKPVIPESVKSEFLDANRNQQIWEWLHHGEHMSEFQFFLSVCG